MSARTIVVTNDFPPRTGGIESFVWSMIERLPPESVVVYTSRQGSAAAFDRELPFPVVRDRAPVLLPTPVTARRAAEIARRHGCRQAWFGAAAPLGVLAPALRSAGVRRSVATTHGHEVWWAKTPGTRQVLHRIGEVNDVVTYLGEYTRSRIAPALSPEAAQRMRQLTPGVDERTFFPGSGGATVRAELGLGDRPVVVCVSRLVPRKGQDMLIRAMPLVRWRVHDAVLLVVGGGPMQRRLEALASSLRLDDAVIFTGERPWGTLPPYFDAGDVFCMPARSRRGGLEVEGLGIVYLEASATGLPVVAGRSGGSPDAVRDGVTGFVVDGSSPEQIADRVSHLLLDRELAARMGAAGRAWVERNWRWDDLAARLQGLLAG